MLTTGVQFLSLDSSYIHLYELQWMIKVKPHSCVEQLVVSDLVVSGASYHTRAQLECDIRPHKQTRSDTCSCSMHSCGFPILFTSNDPCWPTCGYFIQLKSFAQEHMHIFAYFTSNYHMLEWYASLSSYYFDLFLLFVFHFISNNSYGYSELLYYVCNNSYCQILNYLLAVSAV